MLSDFKYPKEGELYKRLTVDGHSFELRYGYYDDRERTICPPVVIFPDLRSDPRYTRGGQPLVTQVQDACKYYHSTEGPAEGWCGDCDHFEAEQPEIGICQCSQNQKSPDGAGGIHYEK